MLKTLSVIVTVWLLFTTTAEDAFSQRGGRAWRRRRWSRWRRQSRGWRRFSRRRRKPGRRIFRAAVPVVDLAAEAGAVCLVVVHHEDFPVEAPRAEDSLDVVLPVVGFRRTFDFYRAVLLRVVFFGVVHLEAEREAVVFLQADRGGSVARGGSGTRGGRGSGTFGGGQNPRVRWQSLSRPGGRGNIARDSRGGFGDGRGGSRSNYYRGGDGYRGEGRGSYGRSGRGGQYGRDGGYGRYGRNGGYGRYGNYGRYGRNRYNYNNRYGRNWYYGGWYGFFGWPWYSGFGYGSPHGYAVWISLP